MAEEVLRTDAMLRFKLVGAGRPAGWNHPEIDFDPDIPTDQADGLLNWWNARQELLDFKGVRAWYISEPLSESYFRTRVAREALKTLKPSEFLHHSNADPRYQVPAETHYGPREPIYRHDRPIEIGATTNNFGNFRWRLLSAHRLRNKFLTDPRVALFGSEEYWRKFRLWPWSRPGAPANYRGHPNAGNCHQPSFWEFLTQFKIYICLENSITPYWFTEKLVNAARAGCVPIYHAHPTVRDRFLNGARWIDPADHGFNVDRTIRAALDSNHEEIRKENYAWLKSSQLDPTEGHAIWNRIASILLERWHEKNQSVHDNLHRLSK